MSITIFRLFPEFKSKNNIMYKLRFCISCTFYKHLTQVTSRTRLAIQVVTCTEFQDQINPTCTILLYKFDLKRILVKLTMLSKRYLIL